MRPMQEGGEDWLVLGGATAHDKAALLTRHDPAFRGSIARHFLPSPPNHHRWHDLLPSQPRGGNCDTT
jgi:hypothetical protein